MPTYAQLATESCWGRELTTPEIGWLGDELCRRTGRPRGAFGTKGDNKHLRGAHRSQEWILTSRYCTSRTYTVQSGLTAAQQRYIAGLDFTPGTWGINRNRNLVTQQTRRLVAALRDGRLRGVREVIGTLDGHTVVGTRADGSTFDASGSHLEHWHLTLDRRRHSAGRLSRPGRSAPSGSPITVHRRRRPVVADASELSGARPGQGEQNTLGEHARRAAPERWPPPTTIGSQGPSISADMVTDR